MRYALLVCVEEDDEAVPDPVRVAQFNEFTDQMLAEGVLEDRGLRLQPSATATSVRVRGGDIVIVDGPFAETKEYVAGFYVVECADLDEAIEVASKIPASGYGTIEVRPVWEM
jgi:hypothetical protein